MSTPPSAASSLRCRPPLLLFDEVADAVHHIYVCHIGYSFCKRLRPFIPQIVLACRSADVNVKKIYTHAPLARWCPPPSAASSRRCRPPLLLFDEVAGAFHQICVCHIGYSICKRLKPFIPQIVLSCRSADVNGTNLLMQSHFRDIFVKNVAPRLQSSLSIIYLCALKPFASNQRWKLLTWKSEEPAKGSLRPIAPLFGG